MVASFIVATVFKALSYWFLLNRHYTQSFTYILPLKQLSDAGIILIAQLKLRPKDSQIIRPRFHNCAVGIWTQACGHKAKSSENIIHILHLVSKEQKYLHYFFLTLQSFPHTANCNPI